MIQTGAHIAGWLGRHEYAVMTLLSLCVLLGLLLTGCSTTRTVTVPAQETSVQLGAPDTTEAQLPPPAPAGEVTKPDEVILYGDTSRPAFDVSLIEVDRTDPDDQEVRIRVQQGSTTVEKRLAMPPPGEGLRVRAAPSGGDSAATNRPRDHPLSETVFGAPTERQVEATTVEVPWYEKFEMQMRLVIAFLGGGVFGVFIGKLFA